MNIVTSADTIFFHCLQGLAESVRKHYDKQLIVYDVGLTEEEKKSIDATVIPIKVDVDFRGYATFSKGSIIKTTHKPFCVKHYFENYTEPMILVDADCLFTKRVEEAGFDVGVTLRSTPKKLDFSNSYSGILNAGVIFFNTNADELVEKWANECQKDNITDQKALVDILSETINWKHCNKIYDWHGIKIKVFDPREYNDCHLRKTGKILHFKSKKHEKGIYEQLIKGYREGKNIRRIFKRLKAK